VTDPNALSIPSHVVPEMAVGFGLALGKLVLGGHIDEVLDTIEKNIRHMGGALEAL
jgi:pyruvate dehydrogenase (quinone)